jgi:hypothetical protein
VRETNLNLKLYQAALAALVALVSLAAGVLVVHSFTAALALVAVLCTVTLFLLARTRPALPMTTAFLALAFIPVYWIPYEYHVFPDPGVLLMLVIVVGGLANALLFSRRLTLTSMDAFVGLFFVVSLMSVILGIRKQGDLTTNLLQWLVPYLAARYLVGGRISYTSFAKIFCAIALALLPFVYVEAATGYNPFQKLVVQPALGEIWAHEIFRNGQPRAAASFGHPIALSMFLVSAAILACALAFRPDARRRRASWLVGSGLLVGGAALTFSRTGWIMLLTALLFGLGIVLSKPKLRIIRTRLVRASGAVVVAVGSSMAFSGAARESILSIFGSDREASTSAKARENILAASGEAFSWFGRSTDTLREVGIRSIDNTYILLTLQWGIIAATFFTLMSVPMVVYLVRWRRYLSMDGALVVVAFANLIGLIFVAPITQQQNVVFMLLGAASAVLARASTAKQRA